MASFMIKDVRIFDGVNAIESGSVLIRGGKIKLVSSSPISFPGLTYSRPGHTLLPGLIDCHIHADSGNATALPQCLRFGVTTACDMHNEYFNVVKLRKQIAEDGDCADLKEASYAATVDMGWPMPVVLAHSTNPHVKEEIAKWPRLKGPEDAAAYVQDRVAEDVDYIKLMHESGAFMGAKFNMPSIKTQKALIEEAHNAGLIAVAHSLSLNDTIEILEAGVDGMTHTFSDLPPNDRLIAAYQKNNAHCNPTLATIGSLTTEGKAAQERYAHDPRVTKLLVAPDAAERLCHCMSFSKEVGCKVENAYESVRKLKAAGIDVVLGSDAAGPAVGTAYGLSAHHEMALFVQHCGFTPAEAIAAGTSVAARRFRFHDRGQIKEGLRADLLLVEGNPLDDIDSTLNIRAVWKEGVLCKAFANELDSPMDVFGGAQS